MAQDNLWVHGPQILDFNQPASQMVVCGLPTGQDYNGAPAQYAQNAQYDENGKLLFFVVDGTIYDHAGYLMADNDVNPNCTDCLMKGIQEISIVLMPGTCDKYYIIAGDSRWNPQAHKNESMLGFSILDLSMGSRYHAGRKGAVWSIQELTIEFDALFSRAGNLSGLEGPNGHCTFRILDGNHPFSGGAFHTSNWVNIHHKVLDKGSLLTDGVLLVHCATAYAHAEITSTGITVGQHLHTIYNSGADAYFYMVGALAAGHGPDGVFRMAGTSNYSSAVNGYGVDMTVELYEIQANGTNLSASVIDDALNTNIYDHVNNLGKVRGITFSPNGRYLYFSQPFPPYIGYIDVMDPALAVHDLAVELNIPGSLAGYGTGQISCNRLPGAGASGHAVYFPSATGMGYLAGADDPATATWHPTVIGDGPALVAAPTSAMAWNPGGGQQYTQYLMDKQNYRDQQIISLQQQDCCMANQRIPEGSHPNTFNGITTAANPWTPQNNPLTDPVLCALSGGSPAQGHVFFSQNFTVQTGARLYVQGMEWRFGPNASLIVEKGAFVQFDNCVLRGDECKPMKWPGVELRGTPYLAQGHSAYPPDQGRLVLQNSTVQDAQVGVTVGKKNAWGLVQHAGGILEATNSTFLNCRVGVNFYAYQNHLPNGSPTRNRSKFINTTFTADADYIAPFDLWVHAQMWKVDGIEFKGCTFQNLRTTETNSSQLGQGIRSLDAHFKVLTLCGDPGPTPPGMCQNVIPSRFTGLDMGIRAAASTSGRNFSVDGGAFEDNVCGVFATGITGYEVVNSHFKIGGSVATVLSNLPDELHWFQAHRGLYSYKSNGFSVDDNTLEQQGSHSKTEGIVIGYSEGHNDIVFRNSAQDLESAYIGEGICAQVDIAGQAAQKGLQFLCNQNSNNSTNFWSRKVTSDQEYNPNTHTIRLNQGNPGRPAGNAFDQWPTSSSNWDFKVTTSNSPIGYWHSGTAPYVPVKYNTGSTGIFPHLSTTIPVDNCANKYQPIGPPIPPNPGPMSGLMDDERIAYENVRYLHEQLIDGGHTEAVVLQIELSWPQDAWALRDYLMGQSPNLSVAALKQMVLGNILPEAMVTEVLTANPGATRTDGFLTWLQEESGHPLPEYLLNMVVASWDQRGYRDALVGEMALHHTGMTQAANWLVQHYRADTAATSLDSISAVWYRLGTVSARYAEAMTWMEAGNWTRAAAIIDTLTAEPDKKGFDVAEQQRMLDLIDFLQGVDGQGRDESQLDSAEVGTLQNLMADAYDRPANWISNLLCFGYDICRAPLTGGDDRGQTKLLQVSSAQPAPGAELDIYPNPAASWVTFHYDLRSEPEQAELVVRDAAGRTVYSVALQASEQQQIWDTRAVASGSYSVVLMNAGRELRTEKLIVKQ